MICGPNGGITLADVPALLTRCVTAGGPLTLSSGSSRRRRSDEHIHQTYKAMEPPISGHQAVLSMHPSKGGLIVSVDGTIEGEAQIPSL